MKNVVFVLGGPGCGKGTQCSFIVAKYGFIHVSAGDLLRAEMARGTELSEELATLMKEGKIVPAEITVRLLRNAIAESPNDRFLVDGFPRNFDNRSCWEKQMSDVAEVCFVLYFSCSEETMKKRLKARSTNSGRLDDNEETMMKRFRNFESEQLPVILGYEKEGLVKKVDASGTPDEVFGVVDAIFAEKFTPVKKD